MLCAEKWPLLCAMQNPLRGPKKGGPRHGHNPKRGVLCTGTTQKRGVLGTGTSRKGGVLRTGLVKKKTILVTDGAQKVFLSLFINYPYFFLVKKEGS